MMKKLSLLALLILSGCSSSDVQKDTKSEPTENAPATAAANTAPAVDKTVPEIKREEKLSSSQYSSLGDAIKQQNDDAIQKTAGELLTQNSKDLNALNALAMVNYKKGRLDAAQYLLDKAIAAHSDSSEAYGNLGLVLQAKNELRDAIRAYRKAIELNSNNGVAGANLGAIYIQQKDYNKATLALEIATKNGQRDVKVMTNYAIALAGTGKTKEAADIYERLLKDNPSQKEVMLNYSILMIDSLQKYKEGLDLLNRLKFVGSSQDNRQIIKDLENKAKAGLQ